MTDDFDSNVAPAQDGEIEMVPRLSDDGESGSNDDGHEPNIGGIEAEQMVEEPNNSASVGGWGLDPALRPNRHDWEDHDQYNGRKTETGLCSYDSWINVVDRDDKSVMSVDTEDSWDVTPEYSEKHKVFELWPSWKKQLSQLRQQHYRKRHSDYMAKLEAVGKVLCFTSFGQLPPKLRQRIWKLHCPEIQRLQRVLQLTLLPDGHMPPSNDMVYTTKSTREFMRICHETRALGERYMPDTLNVAARMGMDGILRYNGQNDIIHFFAENSCGLQHVKEFLDKQKASDVKNSESKMETTTKDRNAKWLASPHTSVRNIAIRDVEARTREPGTYHDWYYTQRLTETIPPDAASHRAPNELRPPGYVDALDYMFPNVENVYVLEYGGQRKIDRWIGRDRSYERHHIRTMQIQESGDKEPVVYLYCWHRPPKGFRGRQALPVDSEVAHGGVGAEAIPANDEAEADDGDFEDDCIINHFASLRDKGVRFSRMLFFEYHTGMEDYYRLRELTWDEGSGTWPDDDYGRPTQDRMPRPLMENGLINHEDEAGFGEDEEDFGDESDDDDFSEIDIESDGDNSERLATRYRETHDKYNSRWSEIGKDRHQHQYKRDRHYSMSVLSDGTEDSWDERVISKRRTGVNDIMVTRKKIVSMHRQQCYRREQTAYVAELKVAGKKLTFTKFGQLPSELRLRIWELHCPTLPRSQRVLHVVLLTNGQVSLDGDMSQQTKSTRRFMRICQETRGLGKRYMPDTLRLDRGVLRYNAQKDIVHFRGRDTWCLGDVKSFLACVGLLDGSDEKTKSKVKTAKTDKNATRIARPHTNVRNIAICDSKKRTREPGNYFDLNIRRHVSEMIRPDQASHREPRELCPCGCIDALNYLFPNVENIYVVENGGPRKINRWIGHDRSYERHHIRTIQTKDAKYSETEIKVPRDYLYCWHGPPKSFRGRQALPVNSEAAPGGSGAKETDEASPALDEAEADDGDFKDDCIINHFSSLRKKGVRFSRMLRFVEKAGMEDYYRLRGLTCPDGTWPNDTTGQPKPDEILRVHYDSSDSDDESYVGWSEDRY